jgi:hypothetical protein
VTRVGEAKVSRDKQEETADGDCLKEIVCNCRFFVGNQLLCSHLFAVLHAYQIKSAEYLKPMERWTKRYNWENFDQSDLKICP